MDSTPFLDQLRRMLPPRWTLEVARGAAPARETHQHERLVLTAPDGTIGRLHVEAKPRVSARQAATIAAARLRETPGANEWTHIVFTPYLGRMAQDRLRKEGVSYLDRTGNAWIQMERPAVYIERQGADSDPDPPRRGVRSLKGAKAARIVRGLCDWLPPLGVRELARRTGTDPGYVTRVLNLLEEEDVVSRGSASEVADVRWTDLIRRWSEDYSVTKSNRASAFLAPRGLGQLRDRLTTFDGRYAVTGSFAVPPEAEVAPGRTLSCYVSGAETAARMLDLRPVEAGANVLLLEPFDPVVFERTRTTRGCRMVALSQCAVDLLTGTGREPNEADALLTWMADNDDAWRT